MVKIEITKSHRGGVRSTTFSGRPEGKAVRNALHLDSLENTDDIITILIPNDTTSFNPSFFLGLLFDSVKKCGSIDSFKKKYVFDLSAFTPELRSYIETDLEDSYQRCENELNKKTGIDL